MSVGLDLRVLVDGAARVLGVDAAGGGEHEAAAVAAVLWSLPNFDGVEHILRVLVVPWKDEINSLII